MTALAAILGFPFATYATHVLSESAPLYPTLTRLRLPPRFCICILSYSSTLLCAGESAETARRLIQKEGIEGISLVLGVDELRKEYRVYERRRKLAASYDIFFADARVIKTLPKLLGNSFFKKKKHPVPVELGKKSWKRQLEFAKRCTHLYISSGTCSYIRAGTSGMGETALTKNIRAIARKLRTSLPGGWDNVQSLHIKTDDSVALPIYQALPDELKRNQQAAQRK
jgi:ribosome biogenesis protein UTP30